MSDEKPLYVKVAEVLGCEPAKAYEDWTIWLCTCGLHRQNQDGWLVCYDTDWSATGPMIEKYRIELADYELVMWQAYTKVDGAIGQGDTALEAVCDWILKAAKDGKKF